MNFSVIPQLYAVLTSSLSTGALFILITLIPWLSSITVRYYKGSQHPVTRAFFWSSGLMSLVAVLGLLMLPPPIGVPPLSLWLVLYFYGFVPFWLALSLVIICLLLLLPVTVREDDRKN